MIVNTETNLAFCTFLFFNDGKLVSAALSSDLDNVSSIC